jgi:VWFA-related protein
MKKQYALLLSAVLSLLASGATAQTHESITVQVIDVPVYVFSQGKPIRNLTKEDFELYVNGKRQTIDYFDPIEFVEDAAASAQKPALTVAPAADPRERRLFLLLFDLAYSRPSALARARAAAVKMVGLAQAHDFFAVGTSTSRGARFLIPFTRDRNVIRRAIQKLAPSSAHDSLAIAITDAERQTAQEWVPDMTGAGAASEDPMAENMAGFASADMQRSQNLAQSHIEEIADIAGRLGDLEGYKHVVFFSEGFSSRMFGLPGKPDPGMLRSLELMAHSFQGAGALLHTLDLGPVGNDVITLERSAASYGALNAAGITTYVRRYDDSRDETLLMFAAKTGGQFLHWTNDFAGALADLSTTVSAGYRLGFKPVNPRKGANKIEVKVKKIPRQATVSFRRGFSSTPGSPDTSEGLLLADIIENDIPQTGTAPAFSFLERPSIDIIVPMRQLAKEHGALKEVTIMLYIFDDKGTAVDYREKKISIPLTPEADTIVRQKLALPPGNYIAKSLLQVEKSIGFARIAFTVPDEK